MNALVEWQKVPALLEAAMQRVTPANLDAQVAPEKYGMTRRMVIHHLAEANVVAASIIIAALGSPGCTYDWSWMMPFGPWFGRLDYAHKPVEPSLRMLETINAYVAAQIEPLADGLAREVFLKDAPEAALRRVTVEEILKQELEHVHEHLDPFSTG